LGNTPTTWIAPPFELPVVNSSSSGTINMDALKGKPIVLIFFTTWDSACEELASAIVNVYPEISGQVQLFGVNIQESQDKVQNYIQKLKIPYPVLLDDGKTASAYRCLVIPTSYFIDSQGVVVSRYIGVMTPELLKERIGILSGQ